MATADGVFRPGDAGVVGAHRPVAQREEAVALRHRRLVEQRFGGRGAAALAAFEDRIVRAGLEPRAVIIAVLRVRDRAVVLLDVRDGLFVELGLERLQRGELRIGVGVLRGEIGEHLRVLPRVVAQPVIIVLARAVGRRHLERLLRDARRLDLRDRRGRDQRHAGQHHVPYRHCAAPCAGVVAPAGFRYRSNQAMIADAFAADCDGRAARPPWLAPGTFTSAVGTPRICSAA